MSLPTRLRSQRWERDEINYGGDWEPMNEDFEEDDDQEEPEEVVPNKELKPERFEIPENSSINHDNENNIIGKDEELPALDLMVDKLEIESLEDFQLGVQLGEDGGLIIEDLNPPTPPFPATSVVSVPPSPVRSDSSVLSNESSLVPSVKSNSLSVIGSNGQIDQNGHSSTYDNNNNNEVNDDNDDDSLIFTTRRPVESPDENHDLSSDEEDVRSDDILDVYKDDSPDHTHKRAVSAGVQTLESLINDVQSDIRGASYAGSDEDDDEVDTTSDSYGYTEEENISTAPLSPGEKAIDVVKPVASIDNELHPVGSTGSLSTGNFSIDSINKADISSEKESRRNSTNTFDMGGWKPNTDSFRGAFVNQNFASRNSNYDDVHSIPATIDATLPSVSENPDEEDEHESTTRIVSNSTAGTRIGSETSTIQRPKSMLLDSSSSRVSSRITSENIPVPIKGKKYPVSNWKKIMSTPHGPDRIEELTRALSAESNYETGLTNWLSTTLKSNDVPEFVNLGNLATKIFQESDKSPRKLSTRTRVLHVKDKVHVASDFGKRFLNKGKKILK
ncbi:uncharacterized protein RJT21DRAFT_35705 [Scheffersomyces amazonensis]|uniref:uncharacterized protein n=1 Tax=Scheffersomyces amazonensis TaxID=1078765 RepID=UPI00315C887F